MKPDYERLAAEEVIRFLKDPDNDGVLRWKIWMGCRGIQGSIAGGPHWSRDEARWTIQIRGTKFLRSRLVFVIHNGRWPLPGLSLDHIDKNTLNDCITNLREVTHQQNMENREPFRHEREYLESLHK
jgi:hypothetical protein